MRLFDEDFLSVAVQEFKILEQVRGHPNVVEAVELFFNNQSQTIYMVLGYLPNAIDLSELIKTSSLDESCIKRIMQGLLMGLDYLHSTALVCHRDIKPANIMTSEDGQSVKIIDFNAATEFEREDPHSLIGVSGEQQYSAPEMTSVYSSKVDIWSAGVVMFEMLSREKVTIT
jgi:serine/threonine-protein kinase MDS1/RIM11